MRELLCVLVIVVMSSLAFGEPLEVVGPGGEVVVYYKDGNDIVVRNCGNDYPVIKKRSDCTTVGEENRVPIAVFKRALQSQFLIDPADKLKPLTPGEVKAYGQANA